MSFLNSVIAIYPLLLYFLVSKSNGQSPSQLIRIKFKYAYLTTLYFIDIQGNYTLDTSLTNQATWIIANTDHQDNLRSVSKILEDNIHIWHKDEEYYGTELESKVCFDENKTLSLDAFQYFFYSRTNTTLRATGKIGLSYRFSDENRSIVHQFKRKGLINQLAFSFVITRQPSLYLGGIPDEIISSHYHSSCDVIGKSKYWDCYLNRILITNPQVSSYDYALNTSETSGYMYFDNDDYFIYAPKHFMKLISDSYLKNELATNKCLYTTLNSLKVFTCAFSDNFLSGNITFVIGNYSYQFPINLFWICEMGACDFQIVENPKGDHWIFGTCFVIKHHIMFDYENNKVHFYSDKGDGLSQFEKNSNQLIIFRCLCVVIIIGCGWIIASKIILKRV